jgi:hypothetical protein
MATSEFRAAQFCESSHGLQTTEVQHYSRTEETWLWQDAGLSRMSHCEIPVTHSIERWSSSEKQRDLTFASQARPYDQVDFHVHIQNPSYIVRRFSLGNIVVRPGR